MACCLSTGISGLPFWPKVRLSMTPARGCTWSTRSRKTPITLPRFSTTCAPAHRTWSISNTSTASSDLMIALCISWLPSRDWCSHSRYAAHRTHAIQPGRRLRRKSRAAAPQSRGHRKRAAAGVRTVRPDPGASGLADAECADCTGSARRPSRVYLSWHAQRDRYSQRRGKAASGLYSRQFAVSSVWLLRALQEPSAPARGLLVAALPATQREAVDGRACSLAISSRAGVQGAHSEPHRPDGIEGACDSPGRGASRSRGARAAQRRRRRLLRLS